MATSAAAAKAPAVAAAPEAAPKKKSKLVLISIILVLLGTLGGAAAWYFLAASAEDEDDESKVSAKPPVFLPVDQFTVNLQPEGGQQFLQVAMTLKVADQAAAETIKTHLPEVRSRVLLLLSNKKPSQLISLEGKTQLSEEIAREVEAPLPVDKSKSAQKSKASAKEDGSEAKGAKKAKSKAKAKEAEASVQRRVLAVFFTHFIVQ